MESAECRKHLKFSSLAFISNISMNTRNKKYIQSSIKLKASYLKRLGIHVYINIINR